MNLIKKRLIKNAKILRAQDESNFNEKAWIDYYKQNPLSFSDVCVYGNEYIDEGTEVKYSDDKKTIECCIAFANDLDIFMKAAYKFYEKDIDAEIIGEEEVDKIAETVEELSTDEIVKITGYDEFFNDSETESMIKKVLRDHFKKAPASIEIVKKEFESSPSNDILYVLHYVKATFASPIEEI